MRIEFIVEKMPSILLTRHLRLKLQRINVRKQELVSCSCAICQL